MTLKFYYHPMSQPCRAVQAFLDLFEIPYETIEINLGKGDQKSPEFLAVNPLGQIPCIDDDGFRLGESDAILKYLIATRKVGESFYPSDPKARSGVDVYYPYHHSVIRPKFSKVLHWQYRVLFPNEHFISEEVITQEAEDTLKKLSDCYLGDKKYINGDELTIADLSAISELTHVYFTTDLDFNKFPRVKAYVERCLENPVIQKLTEPVKAFPAMIKAFIASKEKKE